MLHERMKSRSGLLAIATIGTVLMYLSDFVSLTTHQRSVCTLMGNVLWFVALLILVSKPDADLPTNHVGSAISSIAGICLFLANRFTHPHSWIHGLIGIAALALTAFCWSLVRTPWTSLTVLPSAAIALLQTKWNFLPQLLLIRPAILVAMFIAWVLISLIAFRIIDRRSANV